jgi:hypothetical protein
VLNMITTHGFRRGTIGIRLTHQPANSGIWNALWLLGDGTNVNAVSRASDSSEAPGFDWPCFGEIDMMEGYMHAAGANGFNNPIDQNGSKLSIHSIKCGDSFAGTGSLNVCNGYFQPTNFNFTCNMQTPSGCDAYGGFGAPMTWTELNGGNTVKVTLNNPAIINNTFGTNFNDYCADDGCAYFTEVTEEAVTTAFFGPSNVHTSAIFASDDIPDLSLADMTITFDADEIGSSTAQTCGMVDGSKDQCNPFGFSHLRTQITSTCQSSWAVDSNDCRDEDGSVDSLYWAFLNFKIWSTTTDDFPDSLFTLQTTGSSCPPNPPMPPSRPPPGAPPPPPQPPTSPPPSCPPHPPGAAPTPPPPPARPVAAGGRTAEEVGIGVGVIALFAFGAFVWWRRHDWRGTEVALLKEAEARRRAESTSEIQLIGERPIHHRMHVRES